MPEGLKEIAERAGVSISTVARFVSGKRVRPAYQAAVEAALAERAYEPNLAARRLKTRASGTLGLVVPDLANPFFMRLAEAVENLAWRAGHRVIVCSSNEDPEREGRYVALLQQERIDGLMIAPADRPGRIAPRLGGGLPVVLFDRALLSGPFDTVMLDNADASHELVRALHGAGHRRMVGVFTRAPVVGAQRRRGYRAAMAALDLPSRTLLAGHGPEAQRAAVEEALDRWPDLDVLVAGNSPTMFAAALALKRRGHPASLAGFDQADWLSLIDRPAFWIEQPIQEIAHAGVALLLDREWEGAPRDMIFRGTVQRAE